MQPTSIDLLIHGAAELATSIGTKARGGKLLGEIRVLRDAAVAKPMVIDLPAPPVAVVLSAEGKSSTLFQDLRAEP